MESNATRMCRILSLLVVMLAVVMAGPVFAARITAGCLDHSFIAYTGEEGFSQTITLPVTGDLTDCLIDWFWSYELPLDENQSFTVNKEYMGESSPGIYQVYCILWCPYDWYYYFAGINGGYNEYGPNVWDLDVYDLTPVSRNTEGKTVHYTCTIASPRYTGYDQAVHQPLSSLKYFAYGPDYGQVSMTSITVQNQDSFGAEVDLAYPRAIQGNSHSTMVFAADYEHEGQSNPDGYAWWYYEWEDHSGITYSPSNIRTFDEYPSFGITQVRTSTTDPSATPQNPIEPAYGDNATFYWQRSYNEFHAEAILVLNEDPEGTIFDPGDPNHKYSIIGTASLDDSTNVSEHNQQTSSWNITGQVTWPTPGTHLPEFPSGHHRLGVKYDDGYVQLTGKYVDVALSVYDAYTDSKAPFRVPIEKTSVYYTLSAEPQPQPNGVHIQFGNAKSVTPQDDASVGPNTFIRAWDGSKTQGGYVAGGSYALAFDVTPLSGSVGPLLQIGSIAHNASFTPAPPSNQSLTIGFCVQEPVRRPQATQTGLTAAVYDSNGEFVRLLAADQVGNVNNLAEEHGDGHNELVWNGRDELGLIVEPGAYTITLFAKDNAGVECESNCVATTVTVNDPPQAEAELDWPSYGAGGDDDSGLVSGYTDSDSHSVTYRFDNGQPITVSVDSEGSFSIDVSGLTGAHTATIQTTDSRYGTRTISVPLYSNSFSVTTPENEARFDPQASGDITIQFTSLVSGDTVDIYVVDRFDQPECINPQMPVPVADVMNGTVSERTIKTLATGQTVVAGTNTLTWNGKDSDGDYVRPGIYDIIIQRSNADNLLDTSAAVEVVVEHPAGAPQISEITPVVNGASISIAWNTGTAATTGYVVCEPDDDAQPIFRIPAGAAATSHSVSLPGTTPDTTYRYYIVATSSTGISAVSSRGTVVAGNGPATGAIAITRSADEVRMSYTTETPAMAAVEYARVGPAITPQWMRAEHTYNDNEHLFILSDLQTDSEYAYRIVSSADIAWANSTKSKFQWFTTKTEPCSVSFTNIEDRAGVSAIADIVVRASDSAHRFSAHGITKVELYIDGQQVEGFDKIASGDHVDYTFHAGSVSFEDGIHEIQAIAHDDYWNETDETIQVRLTSPPGGQQSMSLGERMGMFSDDPFAPPAAPKQSRAAQVIGCFTTLSYTGSPRYVGKVKKGSVGSLHLLVLCKRDLGIPNDDLYEFVEFSWPASSGQTWNWKSNIGTLPPGTWHTAAHWRVGQVEGVPWGYFGAYLIHPSGSSVKNWPNGREREAIHIHGNWASDSEWHDVGNGRQEKSWQYSEGCIILHRDDLLDLKNKWENYVLGGEEHGPASIGIPLKVKYKQAAP